MFCKLLDPKNISCNREGKEPGLCIGSLACRVPLLERGLPECYGSNPDERIQIERHCIHCPQSNDCIVGDKVVSYPPEAPQILENITQAQEECRFSPIGFKSVCNYKGAGSPECLGWDRCDVEEGIRRKPPAGIKIPASAKDCPREKLTGRPSGPVKVRCDGRVRRCTTFANCVLNKKLPEGNFGYPDELHKVACKVECRFYLGKGRCSNKESITSLSCIGVDGCKYKEPKLQVPEDYAQEAQEAEELHEKFGDVEEGYKLDDGKLRYDLLPSKEIENIVEVLTKALEKYPAWNWQKVPELKDRYYAAARRHMEKWRMGEKLDIGPKGDGLSHLAHTACCIIFLLWEENNEPTTIEDHIHTGPPKEGRIRIKPTQPTEDLLEDAGLKSCDRIPADGDTILTCVGPEPGFLCNLLCLRNEAK